MKDENSIKICILDIIEEIFKYINLDNGEISVHINLNNNKKDKDFARQSFMFYCLNYILYHFKILEIDNEELRLSLVKYIKVISQSILKYSNEYTDKCTDSDSREKVIEHKYIELNSLRASVLQGNLDLIDFWSHKVEQNLKVIFTHPLLLALYIKTVMDLYKFNIKIDFLQYYLSTAVESFYAWTKIEPNNFPESFNYMDYYYFDHKVDDNNDNNNDNNNYINIYRKQMDSFIQSKLKSEYKNIEDFNTSAIAKIFEGLTYKKLYFKVDYDNNVLFNSMSYNDDIFYDDIEKYLKVIFDRKIKLSDYLIRNYKYGINSLSEVKNTSYICLDTYGHLIIAFVNVLIIKDSK